MHDLPGFLQRNTISLLPIERMRRFVENDARPQFFAAVVRHRLQVQSGLGKVVYFGAEPTKKRTDLGTVEVLAIGLEVFLFVRNPDAPAEFVLKSCTGISITPRMKKSRPSMMQRSAVTRL